MSQPVVGGRRDRVCRRIVLSFGMSDTLLVIIFRFLRKSQPFSRMLTATSSMKGLWNERNDRGTGSRAFFRLAATGEVTAG